MRAAFQFFTLSVASVGLLAFVSCSPPVTGVAQSPAAQTRQANGTIVSAVGDDESQTRRSIDAASRAGKTARYVTISRGSGSHVFPPYAQILRTQSTIIARGYNRMYVWRSAGTAVAYSAAAKDVKNDLPLAIATKLDDLAARPHQPALTKLGKSVCADCLLILGVPRTRHHADPWSALKDPWQVTPDYAFWNAGGAVASTQSGTRKTSGGICEIYSTGPNTTAIVGCYYYTYYQPYQYPYVGGSGGGGGGSSAPPPPPCPPVGGPADLNKAISKDDFAQAVSQAVANNFGGKATTVNTKDSLPNAHEAAEAHTQDKRDASGTITSPRNSIDWSTTGVAAAVKSGQSEAQIYTHEELHIWYETLNADGSGIPNAVPGAGVTFDRQVTMSDGTVMNFSISATNGTLNYAYTGYEHVNIHDQLVGQYGADMTGAMGEALAEATSFTFPGGQPQSIPRKADGTPDYDAGIQMAKDHKLGSATIKTGAIAKKPPTTPDPNMGCGKTAGTSRMRQPSGTGRRSGSGVAEQVGGYTVIWNGALF